MRRVFVCFFFILSSMHFMGEFKFYTYTFPIQCDADITYAVRLYTCNKTPPQKCLYWYNLLDLLNSRYWIDTAKLNVTSEIEIMYGSCWFFCPFVFFSLSFFFSCHFSRLRNRISVSLILFLCGHTITHFDSPSSGTVSPFEMGTHSTLHMNVLIATVIIITSIKLLNGFKNILIKQKPNATEKLLIYLKIWTTPHHPIPVAWLKYSNSLTTNEKTMLKMAYTHIAHERTSTRTQNTRCSKIMYIEIQRLPKPCFKSRRFCGQKKIQIVVHNFRWLYYYSKFAFFYCFCFFNSQIAQALGHDDECFICMFNNCFEQKEQFDCGCQGKNGWNERDEKCKQSWVD